MKFVRGLIVLSIVLLVPSLALASGWPTLYGGKAKITQDQKVGYSTEIYKSDDLSRTSETKVLVSANNSSLTPTLSAELCLDPANPLRLFDCLVDGSRPDKPYYSMIASAHPDSRIFGGRLRNGEFDVDSETVLVYAKKQLIGDVYSASTNVFRNFTSYGDHLGVNNQLLNTTWKLAGYQIDPKSLLYWNSGNFLKNQQMLQNIARLKPFALTNLSSPLSSLSMGSETDISSPEGKIWWVDGDLIISPNASFSGRGTIIVEGDITIQGDINSDNSQFGLIALGNGTAAHPGNIKASGSQLLSMKGVMFAKNQVNFSCPLVYSGTIVANDINLTGSTARVIYDQSLAETPPPGISYFMSPLVNENR